MSAGVAAVVPRGIREVVTLQRPPTWRSTPLLVSYIYTDREVSGAELLEIYGWAAGEHLENPRVMSPFSLQWSSVFHPRFYQASVRAGAATGAALVPSQGQIGDDALQRLWVESVMFLASVTLSAAVVQSRYSAGTLASKYDRLWQAGKYASMGLIQGLSGQDLMDEVNVLAHSTGVSELDRLLAIRRCFEEVVNHLDGPGTVTEVRLAQIDVPAGLRSRFAFLADLQDRLGPQLECVVVYGSSVNSENFADYDLVLVVKHPETVLRKLHGTSPSFAGKELNVGIYSAEELWRMQCLSGDNLAEYGLCIYGETRVPAKTVPDLMMRNLSFGMVRQRQQLGMIGAALAPQPDSGDDFHNLFEYFVKIPANIAKGTFGAMNQRLTKDQVHEWLESVCGFRTPEMQRLARNGDPGRALAESAVATGAALRALNERFDIVRPQT
ncbi:MAG: hypothetical protein ABI563_14430 [Specibacter sp.]